MTILVAGTLRIKTGRRDDFVRLSQGAVMAARAEVDCLDFSVSPDPLESDRVNILEKWTDKAALNRFRQSGPDDGSFELIESFDVMEYDLNDSRAGGQT